MTIWILILFWQGYRGSGGAIEKMEFTTKYHCMDAADRIKEKEPSVKAECFELRGYLK